MSLMNEENPGGNDLAKRLMRRVGRSAALPFRRMGLPFGANDSRIKALRNCHAGRRAFVIANGPSLRVEDLDLLRNEITFASNKIFLAFDSTPWRPTYYFASDNLVGRNNAEIIRNLPAGEAIFDADEMTDQPVRAIVAEMVREKILSSTGEEIPYVTAVVTEMFDESNPNIPKIFCAIYVERPSQKSIIIGKQGAKIRDIGTRARVDIEKFLGKQVYLKLFVKVVEDWRNQERRLDEIGIRE